MADDKKNRVLLCGIGKLENHYIREWVEYHKKLGITNIVLYDNNDIDGERFEDVIGDYIRSGYVIMRDRRGKELAQIPSYNDCYKEFKDKYEWIGYWDIDEFIEFEKCKTVQEFLNQKIFDGKQCIRICWKQYTDNGIMRVENNNYSINRFKEVLTKDFCTKNKIPISMYKISNTQAKSFIRTTIKEVKFTSPHCFLNVPTVNAMGKKCEIGVMVGKTVIWKGAWLKHYRFKTLEEYITKKMVRLWPTAYMNGGKDRLDLDYFFMFNKKTTEKVKFARELTESLDKNNIKINTWTQRTAEGKLINRNWGDDINYWFLPKIFGKNLVDYKKTGGLNYSMIGSIVNLYIDKNTVVWGSGVQVERELMETPKKVCAVRGPLTRRYLLERGIKCPEIYGDPSLLLPYYYYPDKKKKFKIGLIPHWSSLNSPIVKKLEKNKDVLIIKMKDYNKWTDVIDEILSCKYILSESLHGLIMAEAYNVPNVWVDITLKNKYDIKYHDFFLSTGLDREKPMKIDKNFTIDKALEKLSKYKKGKMPDLKALIDACPIEIKNEEFKKRVENNIIVKTKKMNNTYEEGVSICITAYKAKKYIKETLDSVYSQTWFKKHNNWEVIVGIDNCYETFEYMKTIMGKYKNLRVYLMTSNKGTYITTNTIMSLAKYDSLIRFDSDDLMLPSMVETIMKEKGDADFVNFKMENFGRRRGKQMAGGQIWVKHSIFDKFGGYMPWSCSADTEFEIRLKKFVKRKLISKVLFKRRIHTENLTVKKETNFASKVRKKNLSYCNKVSAKIMSADKAVIKRITNKYIEVQPDTNYETYVDSAITSIENEIFVEQKLESSGTTKKEDIAIKKATNFISFNRSGDKQERIRKIYEARQKRKEFGENKIHNF